MSIKEAFSIVKANALGFEYQKGEEIIVERGHNCHFLMGIITKKVRVQGYLSVHFSELRGLCSMNCSSKMFFILCNFSFMNVLSSVPYLKYFADTISMSTFTVKYELKQFYESKRKIIVLYLLKKGTQR